MRRRSPFQSRSRRVGNAPRFWPQKRGATARPPRRGLFFTLRPFLLFLAAVAVWPASDPALLAPPDLLSTAPERIDQTFTRCGRGRAQGCVVDGDTFRLGDRRIRVIGIDAPEVKARCPAEARLAEQATAQLQASLNAGPFEMRGWAHNARDRYDRELMALERIGDGGARTSIGEELVNSGVARRYAGGFRGGWC